MRADSGIADNILYIKQIKTLHFTFAYPYSLFVYYYVCLFVCKYGFYVYRVLDSRLFISVRYPI